MFANIIKSFDIFGRSIQLTFRKQSKFTSEIGGIASIFFYITLTIIITQKSLLFFDPDQATKTVTNALIDADETIDLLDLNYRFALEQVDPRVGEI